MTNGSEVIEKGPVRQTVFAYLREQILRGHLNDGERLVEADIAKTLKVSRTPVREAFRKLEDEGLVEYAMGRGVTVTKLTRQHVDDLYAIRGALEGLAARLAAERITKRELQALTKVLRDITQAYKKGAFGSAVRLHTHFNDIIYRASRNERLRELASRFHEYTEKSQLKSMTLPGRFEEIQQEHQRIVKALESKNPDDAEHAVRAHVNQARSAYLKSLERWDPAQG